MPRYDKSKIDEKTGLMEGDYRVLLAINKSCYSEYGKHGRINCAAIADTLNIIFHQNRPLRNRKKVKEFLSHVRRKE